MDQTSPRPARTAHRGALLATSFTLFSMFFGAGNLIFPPMVGIQAGEYFTPAMIGFLIGGVFLPVCAVIAIGVSGRDLRDLSRKVGFPFAAIFPALVYLSIGSLYGLPRTGAVSFTTAFVPLTHWDSLTASICFNMLFFGVTLILSWSPSRIIEILGKILTPLLLVLLTALVARSSILLATPTPAADPSYVRSPVTTGLLTGYLTMDSVAALAFGIIIVRAFSEGRGTRGGEQTRVVGRTTLAALIAGVLLAVVYVGLAFVGHVMPNASNYSDGALLLSDAAALTLGGFPGRLAFGATVLLACLTTSVGLLSACSEFFHRLFPRIPYRAWLLFFDVAAFTLAIYGLSSVVAIAVPLIIFLYPIAITLVATLFVTYPLRHLTDGRWTFRCAAWMATLWSTLTLLATFSFASAVTPLIAWAPLHEEGLGWLIPTAVALLAGLALDILRAHSSSRR